MSLEDIDNAFKNAKIAKDERKLEDGYKPGEIPIAENFNWLLKTVYDYLRWLANNVKTAITSFGLTFDPTDKTQLKKAIDREIFNKTDSLSSNIKLMANLMGANITIGDDKFSLSMINELVIRSLPSLGEIKTVYGQYSKYKDMDGYIDIDSLKHYPAWFRDDKNNIQQINSKVKLDTLEGKFNIFNYNRPKFGQLRTVSHLFPADYIDNGWVRVADVKGKYIRVESGAILHYNTLPLSFVSYQIYIGSKQNISDDTNLPSLEDLKWNAFSNSIDGSNQTNTADSNIVQARDNFCQQNQYLYIGIANNLFYGSETEAQANLPTYQEIIKKITGIDI